MKNLKRYSYNELIDPYDVIRLKREDCVDEWEAAVCDCCSGVWFGLW